MRCVVLGAGVSGLVAALELLRAGRQVTVVEAAPFAGGRSSSWRTPSGLITGAGLHVVATHYANLLDVLKTAGAAREIQWWRRHQYLRPGQPPVEWRYNRLPSPLHLLGAGIAMPVSFRTRWRLLLAALDAARYRQRDLALLDNMSYVEWHNARSLGNGFVRDIAELAADASTFLSLELASARPVLSWVKYMARSSQAGRIGTWRRPLAEGLAAPLVKAITQLGGEIRFRAAAVGLDIRDGEIGSVLVRRSAADKPCYDAAGEIETTGQDERIECDAVISALPLQYLRALLAPDLAARAGLREALQLETVPAVSVSIAFDRDIQPAPPGAPLVSGCSIRDFIHVPEGRTRPGAGAVYLFLMSGAREWIKRNDDEITTAIIRDFRAVWPPARGAEMVDAAVERIGAAMFAAVPAAHRRRPGTRTGIRNFFLAGDWVRHDLNASMEGAALSGRLAAQAVLGNSSPVRILQQPEPAFDRVVQTLFGPRRSAP
jgi:uncharacterized protein with NAD-binding domain and iron-sulfur cluster